VRVDRHAHETSMQYAVSRPVPTMRREPECRSMLLLNRVRSPMGKPADVDNYSYIPETKGLNTYAATTQA